MDKQRFTILTDNEGYNYTVQDKGIDLNDAELLFLLNTLYEENQQVKDILNELKTIDSFWDSALLSGVIYSIGKVLGVYMND